MPCIYHSRKESNLSRLGKKLGIGMDEFCNFIKLYSSMEEWFHSSNPRSEVRESRLLIYTVLRLLKKAFSRQHVLGHNIPKLHGMTKMQHYICLFGSAMNFYGGLGESCHKYFGKAPGDNTERRVLEFARQITHRIYEWMVFEIANEKVMQQDINK